MNDYLGGYFLFRLKPFDWSPVAEVYTCSTCINDSLVGLWSYSWTNETDERTKEAKETFDLNDSAIQAIRTWVDTRHLEGKVGWINVLADLETVLEYKQAFFAHLDGIKTMAVYFDEQAAGTILQELEPQSEGMGAVGLYQTLLKSRPETAGNHERLIGYDLIGIERGGNFHSFHCHGIGAELAAQFGLTLNRFGLFDPCPDWEPVLAYLAKEENGCEPVPWVVAKIKLISEH